MQHPIPQALEDNIGEFSGTQQNQGQVLGPQEMKGYLRYTLQLPTLGASGWQLVALLKVDIVYKQKLLQALDQKFSFSLWGNLNLAYIEQEMTERAIERFLEEFRDEASMAWTQLVETEENRKSFREIKTRFQKKLNKQEVKKVPVFLV